MAARHLEAVLGSKSGLKHTFGPPPTMDQTCITIHDLSPDGNILFASDSITDILGYQPHDILGRSCFDFFHPDELHFARAIHSRGVLLDKAAVLHYVRIVSSDGRWVSCECCFTIAHDVLVSSIRVYCRGERSQRRASDAPQIRQLFSCSPRDPRYHMVECLSPKFSVSPMEREQRAAIILNRFTRDSTIMFSTRAISSVLGIEIDEIAGNSFYDYVQDSCLDEAIRCLEAAKENDSITYLRFWSKDPRRGEDMENRHGTTAESERRRGTRGENCKSQTYPGVVSLSKPYLLQSTYRISRRATCYTSERRLLSRNRNLLKSIESELPLDRDGLEVELEVDDVGTATQHPTMRSKPSIEMEAVVFCTSDGLVVVLRQARPPIPMLNPPRPHQQTRGDISAAPWGQQIPQIRYMREPFPTRPLGDTRHMTAPLVGSLEKGQENATSQLINSIRDVAVYAWTLVGINPDISVHGPGISEAQTVSPKQQQVWPPVTSKVYRRCETCGQERKTKQAETDFHGGRNVVTAKSGNHGMNFESYPGPSEGDLEDDLAPIPEGGE